MPRSYEQVHAGLFWYHGKASEFPCFGCGQKARDWSYMYRSRQGEELVSPEGAVYSDDFDDYEPMCPKCHWIWGAINDPDMTEARLRGFRKGGSARSEEVTASARAAGPLGGAALKDLVENDPEYREKYRQLGSKLSAVRRTCTECGMTSSPMSIGRHQKFSGHAGWSEMETSITETEEIQSA